MQGKPFTVTWYTQPQLPESLGWPVASPWTSRRAYTASSSDIFTTSLCCPSYTPFAYRKLLPEVANTHAPWRVKILRD